MDYKPGRELDAVIADKVMGLTVVKTTWGKEKQYCHFSIGAPEYWDDHGSSELSNPLPSYSTDIAAAWQVVEKLREDWDVRVGSDTSSTDWRCDIYGTPNCFAEGDTAPHAICLAALKAVNTA